MSAQPTATAETDADFAREYHASGAEALEGAGYSTADLSAYYYELECLLIRVERAETHYEVLAVDYLSTTGDIIAAYSKPMILLDPAACGLDSDLPTALAPRVTRASARVLEAFQTLMDFDKRLEYDGRLFGWENHDSKHKERRQQRGTSKESKNKKKDTDRRSRERFELSIPVSVTGYDENANDWHEAGQSLDLSRSGGCILLRRRVAVGSILYLRMPMPIVLRDHEYLDQTYGTYAVVRWIRPPKDGFRLVGVQFVGELPPLGFHQRPWATFHIDTWDGADRRAETRESVSESIDIEYFNEAERLIKKDSGFIENISTSGVRVCTLKPPLDADLIRVIRPKLSLSIFALVRNRFTGRDGYERLCAQFIGGCSEEQ